MTDALSPATAVAMDRVFFSRGEDRILDDVSLRVGKGDFLAVIGPNGGGKTTLLRILLGMLEPDEGTVAVFGRPPRQARSSMGYVPQYSTLKNAFPATVLDMVLMGAARPSLFGGMWPRGRKDRERAMHLLSVLELAEKAKSSIGVLSGGQRQRALIARALMGRPEDPCAPFLLLLDEPTASIDPAGKHCFYESLGVLRGDITIIIVSHELFIASPFFDEVVFINRTLTVLPEKKITAETLTALFGDHQHDCPLGDLQHASGALHGQGCTHTACTHAACSHGGCQDNSPRP